MVEAEIWFVNLGEWHGQLRETDTGEAIGEEYRQDPQQEDHAERHRAERHEQIHPVDEQALAKALVGEGPGQGVVEGRRHLGTIGSRPLHVPAETRKVDRSNDPTIGQGIAVPVFDVGPDLAGLVAQKRDGL